MDLKADPETHMATGDPNHGREQHVVVHQMKIGAFLSCLVALLVGTRVIGGEAPRYRRYGLEEGLSQSCVYAVAQDRQGYLWVGTQDGLNRFDGYNFRVFYHNADDPHSIPDNWVRCLLVDPSGVMWVGTRLGLARFDPQTERFTHFPGATGGRQTPGTDVISSLGRDKLGRLWIGSFGGGLAVLEGAADATPQNAVFRQVREEGSSELITALVADDGAMLVGTYGLGLEWIDLRDLQQRTPLRAAPGDAGALVSDYVLSVHRDRSGRYWVGTRAGLSLLGSDGRFTSWLPQPDDVENLGGNTIHGITEDTLGRILLGTRDGLFRFHPDQPGVFEHFPAKPDSRHGLAYAEVRAVFLDAYDTVWVGTYGGGLCQIDPMSEVFANYRPGSHHLADTQAWGMTHTRDGSFWVATEKGLSRLLPGADQFRNYRFNGPPGKALRHPTVKDVVEPIPGRLWIAGSGGLDIMDLETETIRPLQTTGTDDLGPDRDKLWDLFQDTAGGVWAAGEYGGVTYFPDPQNPEQFRRFPHRDDGRGVPDSWVMAMAEDAEGFVWVGTYHRGLGRIRRERLDEGFQHFDHQEGRPDSLASDTVFSLYADNQGRMWVGTSGGGLNVTDTRNPGRFRAVRAADGLPNDVVYGILGDDAGYLWLSTNAGIARYHPETGAMVAYDIRDGLQSNEFNAGSAYRDAQGRLYFGGIEGVTRFAPSDLDRPAARPHVVINAIQLFHRALTVTHDADAGNGLKRAPNYTESLELDYRDYVFGFEFSTHHFGNPHKNKTMYKLEGLDKDWVAAPVDKRFASYANVRPGRYVFRVKGAAADGRFDADEARVALTIAPAPWQTWWAYALYALAALVVVAWFVRRQRGRMQAERARMELLRAQEAQRAERRHLESDKLVRMGEEKMKALRTLTGGVAHEINNAVNFGQGSAQNLEVRLNRLERFLFQVADDDADAEIMRQVREQLDAMRADLLMVDQGLRRSAGIVKDLHMFTRAGAAACEDVSLSAALKSVVALVSPNYPGVRFDLHLDTPLVTACNPRELNQVFMHLLTNAGDALAQLEDDRGRVTLAGVEEDGWVRVTITDNGCGMTPEVCAQIFDPFFSTKEVGVGTGMGLSIAYGVVRSHEGTIEVSSAPDQGTTVTVRLPCRTTRSPFTEAHFRDRAN